MAWGRTPADGRAPPGALDGGRRGRDPGARPRGRGARVGGRERAFGVPSLFVLAGLCEISGGYLVWQWWRNASWLVGLVGAALLVGYGFVPTYQPAHFGRVYAAYGGVFVLLSVLWGWAIDRVAPDRFDLVGAALCLAGVVVIMCWPR